MRIIYSLFICLPLILLGMPVVALAKEAGNTQSGSSFNPMLIGLVTLMFILLFAIAILGNVVRQLALVYRDKLRSRKTSDSAIKTILLFVLLSLSATQLLAQEVAAEVPLAQVSPFISGIPKTDFYLLMGIIGFELLIILSLLLVIRTMVRLISNRPELAPKMRAALKTPFLDRFNKSVAVANEGNIVLDHDYDGIRELDNDLPPWWKYGFLLTILVSIAYLWYYHAGGGALQVEEYEIAMQKGEEEKAAYLAKSANNVDENTVKLITDQGELGAAQTIFQSSCAACHAVDGGGGVGPNLTDEYWLHGGSVKDVFKTIKYGVQDKGMKSWKDDFSPKQLAGLASYIKSLKGTKPQAPKEKQGDLFIDGEAPVTDSLSASINK